MLVHTDVFNGGNEAWSCKITDESGEISIYLLALYMTLRQRPLLQPRSKPGRAFIVTIVILNRLKIKIKSIILPQACHKMPALNQQYDSCGLNESDIVYRTITPKFYPDLKNSLNKS